MKALVSSDEMRAAEAAAVERGLVLPALMQLAAHGAAEGLLAMQQPGHNRYLVLAGPGNNGGDAMVVAGLLRDRGAQVRLFTYRRNAPSPVDPPALARTDLGAETSVQTLYEALTWCDVVVDGLLGIGRARPIEPDLATVLAALNGASHRPRVVALDVPTGVDANSGRVDAAALHADDTYTFGYVKRGLLLQPGRALCGAIHLVDVGLPLVPAVPVAAWQPEPADIAACLPRRSPDTNKYRAGAVLALAGSPQYVGAPILATTAALRSGAGYVTLAAQAEVIEKLATRLLETTMIALPSDGDGALKALEQAATRYDAMLVGPGLGRTDDACNLVVQVLARGLQGPRSAVVDADALYALSGVHDWWTSVALPLVLTPHAGEMARLTGQTAAEVDAHRLDVAAHHAKAWNQVVLLKGSPTVVASPDGRLAINPTGNPLLATAGSGDVLTGVIAALMAAGTPSFEAAMAGAYLHGLAADLAVEEFGDRGMLAGDLFVYLPRAIKHVLNKVRSSADSGQKPQATKD
jgi:NAD(P)H-hydrate epimerase